MRNLLITLFICLSLPGYGQTYPTANPIAKGLYQSPVMYQGQIHLLTYAKEDLERGTVGLGIAYRVDSSIQVTIRVNDEEVKITFPERELATMHENTFGTFKKTTTSNKSFYKPPNPHHNYYGKRHSRKRSVNHLHPALGGHRKRLIDGRDWSRCRFPVRRL